MIENRWQQPTGSISAKIEPSELDTSVMIADAGAVALNEGVVIQNSTGEILWCNGAARRLLQLSADQLVGHTWPDLARQAVGADGTIVSSDKLPWAQTLTTGVPITDSVLGIRRMNGRTVWLSVNSKSAISAGDQVVVTLLLDVTSEFNRRAELVEAMDQIAESMFQTKFPSSDRLAFASKTQSSASMGGARSDFCGAHRLSQGRYSFFLGNITSQETEQACVNSFVRHTLHSAGALLHDPHEVLFHLHDAIEWEWPETWIKAIFGYVDIDSTSDSAQVSFACGGLPRPMVITNSGISRLTRNDTMIDDVPARNQAIDSTKMRAGDRLVLSTAVGFVPPAVESRSCDRRSPLRPHVPIGELVDTVHNIAAESERDDEPDCDASVLVIAFD